MSQHSLQESPSTTRACLLTLPPELRSIVLETCTLRCLRALYLTCRTLREHVELPLKYRNVDISTHNLGRVATYHPEDQTTMYEWCDWFPPSHQSRPLAHSQATFFSEAKNTGSVGNLIRDFTWTVNCHYEKDREGFIGSELWPPLLEFFGTLRNVTKLDLACTTDTAEWGFPKTMPKLLFPSAVDVRLCGLMYPQFVRKIFESLDLEKLQRLALDDLQDPGRFHGFEPFPIPEPQVPRHQIQEGDDITMPGPMRSILPAISGRCSSLIYFYYRKSGMVVNWTRRTRGGRYLLFDGKADEQCYKEVATFISTLSATLEEFHLEHGLDRDWITCSQWRLYEDNRAGHSRWHEFVGPRLDSMEYRCEQYLLPIMLQTRWERLKKVVLRHAKRPASQAEVALYRLKQHLGDNAEIVVNKMYDRPCDDYLGKDIDTNRAEDWVVQKDPCLPWPTWVYQPEIKQEVSHHAP